MAHRHRSNSWIQTWLSKVNPEVLFARSPVPRRPRTVYFHQPLPESHFDVKGKILKDRVFVSNQVITSKYTVVTFLPRNLLEQFRRVANIFFAAIAILQFFPRFSTISPGLVILPLIAVLAISAIKDGYEDVKRHQSDRQVNYTPVSVIDEPEWSNPNPVQNKSKTFVKALPLRRKKKDVYEADSSPLGHDYKRASNSSNEDNNGMQGAQDGDDNGWKLSIWEDLRVGDFVKIRNNESVPADIVICATSEEDNVAYVETKNLDGETNLKSRNAVPALTSLRSASTCSDQTLARFTVEAEAPDDNMYRLNAKVIMADPSVRPEPVDLQSVLLRGTVLRNTKWVIGVVLFTGVDTKVVINSSGAPSKRSKVEKQMNPQVALNLALLAAMAVVCAIVESIIDRKFYREGALWTLGEDTSSNNPRINGLTTWANALITFQNIVPISLYISIEVVRSLQAAFIHFDYEMWYEKTDQATLARSWNLSDDLGQIEYIFSDKTGTLTQNAMVFRRCSIGGKVYKGDTEDETASQKVSLSTPLIDEKSSGADASGTIGSSSPTTANGVKLAPGVLRRFKDSNLKADLEASMHVESNGPSANKARTLNGFFTVLSLCHTVIAAEDPQTGAIEYKAQSPDEAALVQAAADVGFVFRGRDREKLSLKTPFMDHPEEYELLNVLEFNSARKRMSVIVRKLDPHDRRIFLLCKGADNVIFERLKPGNDELCRKTESHLEDFAGEGLRTLCLAYKVVSDENYEAWSHRYHAATVQLEGREEAVEEVSAEIETELRLLGATAIEDKLQDGVPETIADLKRAGIKVWVATGDKLETAIAIGYSTNLIAQDSNLILIRGGKASVRGQLLDSGRRFFGHDFMAAGKERNSPRASFARRRSTESHTLHRVNTSTSIVGEDNGSRPGGFILVIDGAALQEALQEQNKDVLLDLSTRCEAVLCCRVSPLQKALIVKLVKDGLGAITLAIGDGANDVSMIQAAHVGVGISGEEGLQAVNSSDYAIAQFRFLKRLLLVHGHYSYARNANMIVNFFYKNIVCIGVLWWYQIHCAWSTQYVFDYTYLLFWNVFWSLATVIAIGIFDRFIDDDVLMALPELYRYGREGKWFGIKVFSFYILDACYQSAVLYFFCTYSYTAISARSDGYDVGRLEYSTTMVIATVLVVNLFNGLNTTAWTNWVFFAVFIGPVLCWLFTVVYSDISPGWFYVATYGNDHFLFRSALYWFNLPLLIVLCILPRYLYKVLQGIYFPTDIDILRAIRKANPTIDVWHHSLLGGKLTGNVNEKRSSTMAPTRPSFHSRRSIGSRTDMATGLQSVHRGFDFSAEEDGVSMRRIQSNLSERRSTRIKSDEGSDPKRSKLGSSIFSSLRKSTLRKKQSSSPLETQT